MSKLTQTIKHYIKVFNNKRLTQFSNLLVDEDLATILNGEFLISLFLTY